MYVADTSQIRGGEAGGVMLGPWRRSLAPSEPRPRRRSTWRCRPHAWGVVGKAHPSALRASLRSMRGSALPRASPSGSPGSCPKAFSSWNGARRSGASPATPYTRSSTAVSNVSPIRSVRRSRDGGEQSASARSSSRTYRSTPSANGSAATTRPRSSLGRLLATWGSGSPRRFAERGPRSRSSTSTDATAPAT